MKIGWATGRADDILMAKSLGFDYLECCLRDIEKMDSKEFSDFAAVVEKSGLRSEALNGFYFPEIAIYGCDMKWVRDYAERALARAKELGAEVAVFGSGGSRAVPDDMTRAEAVKQFKAVLALNAEVADKYGINIAIEPLRYKETNFINTVAEGAEISRSMGVPGVSCIVDFYHLFMNREELGTISENADQLTHAHLARPNVDRKAPMCNEDLVGMRLWADSLRQIGYDKRISLEAGLPTDEGRVEAVAKAAELLRVFK